MRHPADRCRCHASAAVLAAVLLSATAVAPAADRRPDKESQAPVERPLKAKPKPVSLAEVTARGRRAPLTLYLPSVWPQALATGKPAEVKFTVLFTGGAARSQVSLQIRGKGSRDVPMRDDGRGPDLSAGDRIYSAAVRLDPGGVDAARCYRVRARARSDARTLLSGERRLCVSRLPIGMAGSDLRPSNIIVFGEGKDAARVLADQALIRVRNDAGDDRIAAAAAAVGGRVVGSLPAQNVYQIRLPRTQTAETLRETLRTLERANGVTLAGPNVIAELQAPVPPLGTDDPLLGQQWGLDRIRAREAWRIRTGNAGHTIAIIDTGADFDHPDFWTTTPSVATRFATDGSGNIRAFDCTSSCAPVSRPIGCYMNATDPCNNNNAAADANGHGTVVAGFAAAAVNNTSDTAGLINEGIAGATWETRLLIMRFDITALGLAQALAKAENETARIVSISTANSSGFFANFACPAVVTAEAAGLLVVSAAGNDGTATTYFYPGACTNQAPPFIGAPTGTPVGMPVANSEVNAAGVDVIRTASPNPSSYGSWVRHAAPGGEDLTSPMTDKRVLSTARLPCTGCDNTITSASRYVKVVGTSFSAPLVAGAAALLLARDPNLSVDQLRTKLYDTGVVILGSGAVTNPQVQHIRRIDVFEALLTLNEPPTATNLSASDTYTEDAALNLTDVVVSDVDGPMITATLTLSNTAVGGLSTGTSGAVTSTYDAVTGVWTASGALADVNSLLAGVVFNPTANFNGSFTIATSVSDGVAPAITGSKAMSAIAVNDAPSGLPVIGGIPTEDQTLTAVTGAIADADGLGAFSYQWLRGGVNIPGATGSTYVLDDPDVGQLISVRVTYTDGGGTPESLTSAPTTAIIDINDPAIGPPVISGTLTVGQTLTAVTSAIVDADGLGPFSYQWLRGTTPIPGATGSSYVLVAADFGTVANVRVSFIDGHGNPESLTTVNATTTGDPHITTVDGLHYDFQAAGEFVLLRGADGMEIQTRQTPVSTAGALTDPYSGLSVGVSINTAVAARVGAHRVTLQPNIGAPAAAAGLELRVDGVPTTLPASGISLGAGARLVPVIAGAIQVDFPDGTTMVVTPRLWTTHNVWYLNMSVFHTSASEGIMGARQEGSWLPRLADGTSLGARPAALPDRYVDLYEKFANSWRVNKQTSLFDYAQGTSTGTFTLVPWPPQDPPFVVPQGGKVAKLIDRKIAQQQCRAIVGKNQNADCVFDVMVTGHLGFARAYLLDQRIRDGLTSIVVRDDKATIKSNEPVTFTATVIKSAALSAVVERSVDPKSKPHRQAVPTGTVQFTLDGRNVGKPVQLDAKGQARVKLSRKQLGTRQLAARYLPAQGSVFLASRSLEEPRKVTKHKD